jgi:hypothetical protein
MCNSPEKKKSGDLPRNKHIFAKRKQLGITLTKISQNSLQVTNFSSIKQYSNESELTEYNSGVWLPLPT